MATIDVSESNKPIQGGTWGNASKEHFKYKPAANLSAGDKVLLTRMQQGTKLLDAMVFIEDAVVGLTFSLGYNYIDATTPSGTTLTDDEAYFFSATDVAANGRFRAATNKPPVELLGDAYLVATFGASVFATTNQLDVVLDYDFRGLS